MSTDLHFKFVQFNFRKLVSFLSICVKTHNFYSYGNKVSIKFMQKCSNRK